MVCGGGLFMPLILSLKQCRHRKPCFICRTLHLHHKNWVWGFICPFPLFLKKNFKDFKFSEWWCACAVTELHSYDSRASWASVSSYLSISCCPNTVFLLFHRVLEIPFFGSQSNVCVSLATLRNVGFTTDFTCSGGWLYTHAHMGSINYSVILRRKGRGRAEEEEEKDMKLDRG